MIVASLGAVPLAAHYVCMNLMDIFYYFAMGLGFAVASHTGQNLGHKRPDLAKAFGRIGARMGLSLIHILLQVAKLGKLQPIRKLALLVLKLAQKKMLRLVRTIRCP